MDIKRHWSGVYQMKGIDIRGHGPGHIRHGLNIRDTGLSIFRCENGHKRHWLGHIRGGEWISDDTVKAMPDEYWTSKSQAWTGWARTASRDTDWGRGNVELDAGANEMGILDADWES